MQYHQPNLFKKRWYNPPECKYNKSQCTNDFQCEKCKQNPEVIEKENKS